MELVDVTDSKSVGGDTVWVRVPPPAPNHPGPCWAPGGLPSVVLCASTGFDAEPQRGVSERNRRNAALLVRRRPTTGTTSSRTSYRSQRRFLFQSKRHRSFTPSLLLSKSNPLRWASIWGLRLSLSSFVSNHPGPCWAPGGLPSVALCISTGFDAEPQRGVSKRPSRAWR